MSSKVTLSPEERYIYMQKSLRTLRETYYSCPTLVGYIVEESHTTSIKCLVSLELLGLLSSKEDSLAAEILQSIIPL